MTLGRTLRGVAKSITPEGVAGWIRRRRRLRQLGIPPKVTTACGGVQKAYDAAEVCRFELWPEHLRHQHGWTMVDVGANRGQFLFAALSLSRPGQVFAYEPLPDLAAGLQAIASARPEVRVRNAAVGQTRGKVTINRMDVTEFSSVLQATDLTDVYTGWQPSRTHTLEVEQVTLDEELAACERVGLLKLDVQGYEAHVLGGAEAVLVRTDCVMVEINYLQNYLGEAGFDTIHSRLTSLGFKLRGVSAPFLNGRGVPVWADAAYHRIG